MKLALRVVLVAVLVATALPALAGGGPLVGLDLLYLRPANSARDYVLADPRDDLNVSGDVRSAGPRSKLVPRLTLGWRWTSPAKTSADVTLSLWKYDTSQSDSAASGNGVLWDILSPPNVALGGSRGYLGTAAADAGIEATQIDLAYSRDILVREGGTLRFRAGLRHVAYEASFDVRYAGEDRRVLLASSSKLTATGVRGGLVGALPLGKHFHVEAEAAYGLLLGNTKVHATVRSDEAFPAADLSRDQRRGVATLEAALRVRIELGRGFCAGIGLEWARWSGVMDDVQFADDINVAAFTSRSTDAVWEAVTVGAAWRF